MPKVLVPLFAAQHVNRLHALIRRMLDRHCAQQRTRAQIRVPGRVRGQIEIFFSLGAPRQSRRIDNGVERTDRLIVQPQTVQAQHPCCEQQRHGLLVPGDHAAVGENAALVARLPPLRMQLLQRVEIVQIIAFIRHREPQLALRLRPVPVVAHVVANLCGQLRHGDSADARTALRLKPCRVAAAFERRIQLRFPPQLRHRDRIPLRLRTQPRHGRAHMLHAALRSKYPVEIVRRADSKKQTLPHSGAPVAVDVERQQSDEFPLPANRERPQLAAKLAPPWQQPLRALERRRTRIALPQRLPLRLERRQLLLPPQDLFFDPIRHTASFSICSPSSIRTVLNTAAPSSASRTSAPPPPGTLTAKSYPPSRWLRPCLAHRRPESP